MLNLTSITLSLAMLPTVQLIGLTDLALVAIYAITVKILRTINQEDAQLIKEIAGEKIAKLITKILI